MQCSNWGSAELTKPQLTYAATDAWLAHQLAQQLYPLLLQAQQQQQQQLRQPAPVAQQLQQKQEQEQQLLDMFGQGSADPGSSNSSSLVEDAPDTSPPAVAAAGVDAEYSAAAGLCFLLLPFALQPLGAATAARAGSAAHSPTHLPSPPLLPQRQQQLQQQVWQQQQQQQQQRPPSSRHGPYLPPRTCEQQQQQQQQHQEAAVLLLQLRCRLPTLQSVEQKVQLLWQTASKLLQLQQQQQQQQQQAVQASQPAAAEAAASTQVAAAAATPPAAAAAATSAQQQQQQQQQQQLARLGLSAAAPRHSIYDKLHTLKPARLPTRKALQYENCRILSPEGVGLATCGLKKVRCMKSKTLLWTILQSQIHLLAQQATREQGAHGSSIQQQYFLPPS
jgi:hypothetical protein